MVDDLNDDTNEAWWLTIIENLGPDERAALDQAELLLAELADCPRHEWLEELRILEQWYPMPQKTWLRYAAQFRQAANALEGRPLKGTARHVRVEDFLGEAADTRHILKLSFTGVVNPFVIPLPQDLTEAAQVLRQEAAVCKSQAMKIKGDRTTGVVFMRQRFVERVLARAGQVVPYESVRVLLRAIGWDEVTVAGLKMARSRRGHTARPNSRPRRKGRVAGLPRSTVHVVRRKRPTMADPSSRDDTDEVDS